MYVFLASLVALLVVALIVIVSFGIALAAAARDVSGRLVEQPSPSRRTSRPWLRT